MLSFFAIFFGLIFGSFLNVITYRLPNNQSIVRPRSFCPNCKRTIPWFENIPIFSWIRLKGKCSSCKQLISIKYPLTEVLTGILFLLSLNAIPNDINFANFIFSLIKGFFLEFENLMVLSLFHFLIFAFSQIATPGPANMIMLATGAKYGFRKALPFVFGVIIGKQIIIWPIGFGLMLLNKDHPYIFIFFKYVSAGYIFWLAWRIANMRISTKSFDK